MSSKDIHDMQDPRHQFYDGKYEKQQQEAPGLQSDMAPFPIPVKRAIKDATGWPAGRHW